MSDIQLFAPDELEGPAPDPWMAQTFEPETDLTEQGSIEILEPIPQDELERAFVNAKAYLLQTSSLTGLNLYDHLAKVIARVLDDRPDDAADIIEDLSRETKQMEYHSHVDTVLDSRSRTTELELAEREQKLFCKTEDEGGEGEVEEDVETILPNLLQQGYNFEQAGIGLNREENYRVWLHLKTLIESYSLAKVRFWGKILGIEYNYIVAEAEITEENEEEAEEEENEDENKENPDDEEEEEEEEIDEIPKPKFKPLPVAPKEEKGTGVNRKTYFVCTEPGKDWIRLPVVTPQQIVAARNIKKFFTGRLDAPVISFPPFPGNEANYLRAQIARISASTLISPAGFYQFDEEEDFDEEEGKVRETFIENPEFEPIPVRDLIDPTMANWVHHGLAILPQGRCSWWNPSQKKEEEEDEEEELEEPEEHEPEVAPPLLTPLSEDEEVNGMAAWTTQISSRLVPQFAVAVIRSVLWPGAYAVAVDKIFENIYIGWGHKFTTENYSPPELGPIQEEFPSIPEIAEMDDPTPEEEARARAAEEEEEDEEDEDDNEDEDDD